MVWCQTTETVQFYNKMLVSRRQPVLYLIARQFSTKWESSRVRERVTAALHCTTPREGESRGDSKGRTESVTRSAVFSLQDYVYVRARVRWVYRAINNRGSASNRLLPGGSNGGRATPGNETLQKVILNKIFFIYGSPRLFHELEHRENYTSIIRSIRCNLVIIETRVRRLYLEQCQTDAITLDGSREVSHKLFNIFYFVFPRVYFNYAKK